jgi:hypothetical protein
MVTTPSSYQSDMRSLSDADLATLSAELSEAYTFSGYEEEVWTDSAAEERYWEMRHEIRRRWAEANPDEAGRQRQELGLVWGEAAKVLSKNLNFTRMVNREYDRQFASQNIGDSLTVRRPARFR